MIRRYRHLPTQVEAIQYTQETRAAIIEWIQEKGGKVRHRNIDDDGVVYDTALLFIQTLEGEMSVNHFDYVVRGIAGEFFPVKPSVFVDSYEET